MDSPSTDLHFILFPLMGQGHMIPIVDIARMLAQRGATVTIVTTPVNAKRYKSIIIRAIEAKLKIQVLELQLPLAEVGLPEGCESFDLLPSFSLGTNLISATYMLEEPAEKMLRSLSPAPSCIISDSMFPWTADMAKRLNIPRLIFYGPGCFAFVCIHKLRNTNILDEIDSNSKYFELPGLPDKIEITKPQASTWGKGPTKELLDKYEQTQAAEKSAFGIVVNSFHELEPKYVEELEKASHKQVWCIGPVSLCNKNIQDIAERGNKAEIDGYDCLKWLDLKEPKSVVYVCFGSLSRGSPDQAVELALGLELSNIPFIWFIRSKSDEFERWVIEEGYEKRIQDKGLTVRGWAPQVLILSHQAIGGFVTHCGWNSTLEGICAGVPMITWPHFAEQFLNERFIIDVLKIGVRIGVEVPILFGEKDKFEVIVKRGDIKMAVEALMDDEEEDAKARRQRVSELREMANRAMEEGGSSQFNLTLMIQAITKELAKNSSPV
uniref:UDP-glycosyltransferase 73E1-like n=1 Tax=Erigeron canadensis TaxID=72917 RepID=UPI001CB981FE|nr:UDP-glycosyltransferase 73E1-like [Erigeron canadensis]